MSSETQVIPDRKHGFGKRCSLTSPEPSGDWETLDLGNRYIFGISSTSYQCTDRLSCTESAAPQCRSGDTTHHFKSEDVRGANRWWIMPLALQNIRSVDPGYPDFNQDLIWALVWNRPHPQG
jgi:hypothetical protein